MKVFFIYPSADSQLGFNYGIAHMAAGLKAAGHDAACWQLCEELAPLPDEKAFIRRIQQEAPDILAFSVVTNQWPYTQQLAAWARPHFSIPFILGGVHTLTGLEDIFATGLFDYVFRGECEDALVEFVNQLQHKQSVDQVRNLAYLENGDIQVNPLRPLPNLKALPRKDYSIMDFQHIIDKKNGWVGLMASRGCPYACSYCFNHLMVAAYRKDLQCSFKELNYIRHGSVDQLIDEIDYLLKHYNNIRMFIFDDDLFIYDKDYVHAFCQAYKKRFSLPFVVNGHVTLFDEARARDLAQAGCSIVKFGVESGSPDIRRRILNRHMTNEAIIQAIDRVHTHGMHSSIFLIIGFPHETRENVMETIRLMGKAKPGRFRWTFFYPFPGTQSYQISRDGGFIDQEKIKQLTNFTDQSCLVFAPDHDLFLQKVGKVMPWFVNAYSDLPAADLYKQRVNEILNMDQDQWNQAAPTLIEEDKKLSQQCCDQGQSHYAIKYNRFMGVISDYFLNEA